MLEEDRCEDGSKMGRSKKQKNKNKRKVIPGETVKERIRQFKVKS